MNKQVFSLLLLLIPFTSFSQVGVGTNYVHPSAKFQIESNDKGFLQPRIALDSTKDITTIANPVAGLMVYNTATAGSGTTAITPGVHYFDGIKWVRMEATQSNTGTSSPAVFVSGQFLNPQTSNRTLTMDGNGTYHSPALKLAAITLPSGKWEVNVAISCEVLSWNYYKPNFNNYTNTSTIDAAKPIKMMYWIQADATTPEMMEGRGRIYTDFSFPPSGGGDTLFRNSANLVQPIQNSTSYHTGNFFINNSSGAEKVYYLFAFEQTQIAESAYPYVFKLPEYAPEFAAGQYTFNRFYAKKIE